MHGGPAEQLLGQGGIEIRDDRGERLDPRLVGWDLPSHRVWGRFDLRFHVLRHLDQGDALELQDDHARVQPVLGSDTAGLDIVDDDVGTRGGQHDARVEPTEQDHDQGDDHADAGDDDRGPIPETLIHASTVAEGHGRTGPGFPGMGTGDGGGVGRTL